MPVAAADRSAIHFRALFPSWEKNRPVSWFFAEELLQARSDSAFCTNQRGNDEDVNIYLIGLLTRWATEDVRAGIAPGLDPLLSPPQALATRRQAAEYFRRQADHRLLSLGLFDRGDLVRRRRLGWRLTEAETRQRDVATAVHCYERAAELLARCQTQQPGLASVWRQLAAHLPDYVHVLQTLARRRLGLGARLADSELARLLAAV